MINYLISILISLGFWGKATQEAEEKTEKSSWLRTLIYAVLTLIVCVLFYKTYQIQQSSWCIFAVQAKGAYNQKGESLDSLSIMVRKFTTAHDPVWMKTHNEDYYWSGIVLEYLCSNDSNIHYKLNRNNDEFLPLNFLGSCPVNIIPDKTISGYSSIDKVKKDINAPGPMQNLLLRYSEEQMLEPWEKHVLHNYEDTLYKDLAAAYKVFLLINKPESLRPFIFKDNEEKLRAFDYPFIESIKHIDSKTIRNTLLTFSFMNGERMSYEESLSFFNQAGLMNGDLYEITSFVPKEFVEQMPKGKRWMQGYHASSEEYSTDFFSAFDLSQSSQLVQITSEVPVGLLQIRFDIPYELIGSDPQPDYLTTTDIGFKDPTKLKRIQERGVNFHVKFPTMENKQLIRSLILTTLLTALLSLFLSNLYYCLRKYILSLKEEKHIAISKKFQYLVNALIISILGCLIYYSYILVCNEKIVVNEGDVWYYITFSIITLIAIIVLIIWGYKKLN